MNLRCPGIQVTIVTALLAASAVLPGCTALSGNAPRRADLVGAAPAASLVVVLTPHVAVLNKYGKVSDAELAQIAAQMRESIGLAFSNSDYVVISQERVARWLSTMEQMSPPSQAAAQRFGQRLQADLIVFDEVKTRKADDGRVDAQITMWIHDGKSGQLLRRVDWFVQGSSSTAEALQV